MSNKVRAIAETSAKVIIHKNLAKAYLDTGDYEKLMEIVSILRMCDKVRNETIVLDEPSNEVSEEFLRIEKEVLAFGGGEESHDP